MKFILTVFREWKETGTITVEALDSDDAREQALDSLQTGDDGIEWSGSNMDPGDQGIDDCKEIT